LEIKSPKWFEELNLVNLLEEFRTIYEKRPIKNNNGGMLSTHMFYVWVTTKALKPKLIVDSGTYKGQSAWLLKEACPSAKIISFDPQKKFREISCEGIYYESCDFSQYDWSGITNDSLVLFDDHQNAYTRLQQCKWFGFKNIIFEDNYPISQGDCYSLKKIISCSGFRSEFLQENSKFRNYLQKIFNSFYKKFTGLPSQMEQFQAIAVKPNKQDKFFLENNLDIYFEFPPIYKAPTTRWGDTWNEENYPTSNPLIKEISDEEVNSSDDFYKNECKSYTWICFARIKNS
tara:strand:+ start:170 stop:1033 length:864 start_codon:yes stop_codon:yes gene_type:complete